MVYVIYKWLLCVLCPSITGSIAIHTSLTQQYSEHFDFTFFTGLNCNGTEDHLFDCLIDSSAPACSSTENDANVICPGLLYVYI